MSQESQTKQLHNSINRIIYVMTFPLGYLLFLRDNVVYHFQENG